MTLTINAKINIFDIHNIIYQNIMYIKNKIFLICNNNSIIMLKYI